MFTRIHHAGLVVPSLADAKKVWVDAFGFQVDEGRSPLPNGRHVPWDNVNILDVPLGDSELELNQPNDTESGTARYMQRVGPGLHHLCLYSDDIDADVERLKEGGLQQLGQTSGSPDQKGGARVAFFHPRTNLGFLLEVWQNMPDEQGHIRTLPREATISTDGVFTRLHHVGFVVPDMEQARHLFCDIYGLKVDESRSPLPNGRPASDNVRILDIPIGMSEIEISCPQDTVSGTARFLARRGGPAMHHVCPYAEDPEAAVDKLKRAGLQQIGELPPRRPGRPRVGWFHPKSTGGVLVELWHDTPPE